MLTLFLKLEFDGSVVLHYQLVETIAHANSILIAFEGRINEHQRKMETSIVFFDYDLNFASLFCRKFSSCAIDCHRGTKDISLISCFFSIVGYVH